MSLTDIGHRLKHPKKAAMLAALAKTGNVSASARAADIERCSHYRWLRSDPAYAAAVDQAMEEAIDVLEAVARKRAIIGSDTLLIFLLKGARPEKYRERYEHRVESVHAETVRNLRKGMERLMRSDVGKLLEAEMLG